MPISMMGLFSDIFNKIMNAIFNPIREWFTNILSSVFKFIVETVIEPILVPVFKTVMDYVGSFILDWWFKGVYAIFELFLYIIDVMQTAFDVLIGIQPVTYRGADGVTRTDSLVNVLVLDESIRNVLIAVTLVAFGLALIFAIYATIRSTLDFDFENKRPVGQVLKSVFKTMINFLLVPITMVFMLYLSSVILNTVSTALSQGSDMSLGRSILVVSSLDTSGVIGSRPSVASMNVQPWADLAAGKISYWEWPVYYHLSKVDYAIGFISSIFMIIVVGMCLLNFIRRIFDIILLYITSPYFVSTMVLDDGEKFRKWRSTFIAKVFSGYGSAIGMRLYLMIVPLIMSDKIQFFSDNIVGNLGDYLIKLIFIMGGAWAVYKSSSMLTTILDQGVGYDEHMTNMAAMGMMGGAFRRVKGAVVKGVRGSLSKKAPAAAAGAGAGAAAMAGHGSSKFSAGGSMPGGDRFNGGARKPMLALAGPEGAGGTGAGGRPQIMPPNMQGGFGSSANGADIPSGGHDSGAFGAGGGFGGSFTDQQNIAKYFTSTFSGNAQENLNMFDLSEGMTSFGTTDKQAEIPEGFTFVPDFVPKDQKDAEYAKMKALNPKFAPVIDMMQNTDESSFYYKTKSDGPQVGFMNAAGFNFDVPSDMAMIPRMMKVEDAKKFCAEKSGGSDFMSNYYKRMGAQLDGKSGLSTNSMADSFGSLRSMGAKGVHMTPSSDGKTLQSVSVFDGAQLYTRNNYETGAAGSAVVEMVNDMGFKGAENFGSPLPNIANSSSSQAVSSHSSSGSGSSRSSSQPEGRSSRTIRPANEYNDNSSQFKDQ